MLMFVVKNSQTRSWSSRYIRINGWFKEFYDNQGNYDRAEPLYASYLEKKAVKLGADHADTLTSMKILAELYNNQDNYDQAEPLYGEKLSN